MITKESAGCVTTLEAAVEAGISPRTVGNFETASATLVRPVSFIMTADCVERPPAGWRDSFLAWNK